MHRCTQTDDLEEGMQGEAARRRTRGTQGKVKQSRTTVLHYALRMDLAAPSHLHEPAGFCLYSPDSLPARYQGFVLYSLPYGSASRQAFGEAKGVSASGSK